MVEKKQHTRNLHTLHSTTALLSQPASNAHLPWPKLSTAVKRLVGCSHICCCEARLNEDFFTGCCECVRLGVRGLMGAWALLLPRNFPFIAVLFHKKNAPHLVPTHVTEETELPINLNLPTQPTRAQLCCKLLPPVLNRLRVSENFCFAHRCGAEIRCARDMHCMYDMIQTETRDYRYLANKNANTPPGNDSQDSRVPSGTRVQKV